MDVISYGAANKASKKERRTRHEILAEGVEGDYPNTKERIDDLEDGIESVNEKANKLIIQDSINIMKAHARLNAIAGSMKYKMYNMVFDDLLDLSGIDTSKSSEYTYDAVTGTITAGSNCVIETKEEVADSVPRKIILTVELLKEEIDLIDPYYQVSRDNGSTWEYVIPDTLFYFTDNISPVDNRLRLKINPPSGVKLLNYALTWA